ncbi:glucose 1-dehydrogenase [Mesorhizobium sp. CGMCC 1.15528]|uniref:Glucose 1-dehydrogenase n=1 Tax=Mesorhizobium zhangyense TaxID=1776730 RepID=A0A7C9REE9_9HYPH|nr:glucose 1-dehydrogenase [Mesorhizobium zhangyense]NGN44653.1 glucose 1-dehydrogenase [Mesorhizobium zhangyense]
MKRLSNKVTLVTGAAQGIGHAIATLFVAEGAIVYMSDVADAPKQPVEGAIYRRLDVGIEADWATVVDEILARHQRLDVLVNNAGIVEHYGQIHETSTEAWDRVVRINQSGTFFGMREVIPQMKKNGGGSIVNFSSIWGTMGAGGAAPYQAAKGAVRTLTKNAAISYAKDNVRVNSVHPGIIWTPLIQGQSEGMNAGIVAATPMGRVGTPREVAFGCLFLASDESSFVTGLELNIDGGYLAQ